MEDGEFMDVMEIMAPDIGKMIDIAKANVKTIPTVFNVMGYGAKGNGSWDDTNSIQSAISAAAILGGCVFFPPCMGSYKVTSFTVPSNVTLWFVDGAKLSINSGSTVTINGGLYAGLYQVFSGAGTVTGALKVEKFYPQWWGAKGNGVTDDTTAIQKSINTAMDAALTVYLPDGIFLTSSTLTIDNTTSPYFSDPRKINFVGAGQNQTTIRFTGTGSALKLIGGKTGEYNSFMTYQQIEDIRFLGVNTTGNNGITIDTCSFLHIQHVEIQGFDYGFDATDMDNSSFTKCIIHYNNYGIKMQERIPRNPLSSTRPNNINFYDCQLGGNMNWGGLIIGGSNVNFFGGDVQGNGIGGTDATKWGLMFLDMSVQGAVACNLYGVFFESNQGIADLWVYTQSPSVYGPTPAVYNVVGCIFNRTQNTWICTNNILIGLNDFGFGQQRVNVTGCGFKNFNDAYTPSAARPHVSFSLDPRSTSNFNFTNNIQSNDVEAIADDKTMPLPTTTVGAIGEYKEISAAVGAALSLPAGGTWEWSGFWFLNSTGAMTTFSGVNAGIAAGGTTILAAHATYVPVARVRRIS